MAPLPEEEPKLSLEDYPTPPPDYDIGAFWKYAPAILQAGDAATAYWNVKNGGKELNPLQKGLVGKPLLNVPFKVGLGLLTSYAAGKIGKMAKNKKVGKIIAGSTMIPPAVGIASNLAAISRTNKNKKARGE